MAARVEQQRLFPEVVRGMTNLSEATDRLFLPLTLAFRASEFLYSLFPVSVSCYT